VKEYNVAWAAGKASVEAKITKVKIEVWIRFTVAV
jgi:hypothetical protein